MYAYTPMTSTHTVASDFQAFFIVPAIVLPQSLPPLGE
jgi:hypothetical protein